MKFKEILLIFMVLLIALLSASSVCASQAGEINDTQLLSDDLSLDVQSTFQEGNLSDGNVIVVEDTVPEGGEPNNEMNNHDIKKAIDGASAGDTILIKGKAYQHVHLIIDKQLTIRSDVATEMTPCSSTMTSGHVGIFYFSSKASGSVLEGFTLSDQSMYGEADDYGVLIRGASDITIRNCTINTKNMADAVRIENSKNVLIENVTIFNSLNGINIVNCENVTVRNSTIRNSGNGINVVGSTRTLITGNLIYSNKVAGVNVGEGSSYTTVIYNNITDNKFSGVNLTSSEQVYILSNYIAANRFGVYVNCNITRIVINGNFFNQNTVYEIYDDYRTRNLAGPGGEKLQEVNNNYMIGLGERPVYNDIFKYMGKNQGEYSYDAANDAYTYVGANSGEYSQVKDAVFLGYTFAINEYTGCPVIYFTYGPHPWYDGNYLLVLSNITQNKKGVYSISIVNANGEIASDLSSVPVTFYLNKNNTKSAPQEGDVYRTVMIKNGTATARFSMEDFKESGNVVMAVVPSNFEILKDDYYRTFKVDDADIPGEISNTTLEASDLTTYPQSGECLIATLKDITGKAVVNAEVVFNINSRSINATTDENGQAKINVSEDEGDYPVNITYNGDDDYAASGVLVNVAVKKDSTQIIASDMNMVPKMAEKYAVELRNGNGEAIANQTVTIKVNGKTYKRETDGDGQAAVKLKFKKEKSYKISISFAGNGMYGASKKTCTIKVKYSSKTSKLVAPKVTIPPKTSKTYTVTLKDGNGNGIAKQKVAIKLNGKTYNKKTNSKGKASVKVKLSKLKTYKVKVTYKGNKIYQKASAKGKIKVAKTATELNAPEESFTPKTASAYTVTLKTTDGKALSKQKVTIKVNGKSYKKTTNSKGKVTLKIKFDDEKTYPVTASYRGNTVYKASKAKGSIEVAKRATTLLSYNKTFAKDSTQDFIVTIKDSNDNLLQGQKITLTFNNRSITLTSDVSGQVKVNLASQNITSFDVASDFKGNDQYIKSSTVSHVTISNRTNVVFVDRNLPNDEIQSILDGCDDGANVEILGENYSDIALNVNKGVNIYSLAGTAFSARDDSPAFKVSASNVKICNLSIVSKENDGIVIENSTNVDIVSNAISNDLNQSKKENYLTSETALPGYGISVSGSKNINITDNVISLFESGIYAEYSSNLIIKNNTLMENNYGIKYGFGVSDSTITQNVIFNQTGLYTNLVPEGPRGYGIFLNNSAVNVNITGNNITWNHLGISIDANNTTGIAITSNLITDNVLEGMRFNAGYDLAENAVTPVVTDNAVYRNARGPSMMILGELSANPGGIYGPGQWNESLRLKIGPNWYGKNNITTWDYETGVVGYGTMCPRISTTTIAFRNVTCTAPGNFSLTFYKDGEVASNLPEFDLFATLNNKTEVNFHVVDGVGTFSFEKEDFNASSNVIDISIGSLANQDRIFKPIFTYEVADAEVPA